MTWDLSDIFTGIEAHLRAVQERAQQFEQTYRGRIETQELAPAELRAVIVEYETIAQGQAKPLSYSNLVFSADTSDPRHGAFIQRMRERGTEISLHEGSVSGIAGVRRED